MKSGTHLCSTGNETANLCQEKPITIEESTKVVTVELPARSLNTYIFMIDEGAAAIKESPQVDDNGPKTYYDLRGHRLPAPKGIYIES